MFYGQKLDKIFLFNQVVALTLQVQKKQKLKFIQNWLSLTA
jgi:hypothetical protein